MAQAIHFVGSLFLSPLLPHHGPHFRTDGWCCLCYELPWKQCSAHTLWHGTHNHGTYTKQSYGGDVSASRLTGDGKYTDKMIFTLTDEGESCKIEACSESQVFSIGDAGTNYCNVKLLVCGSDQGCNVAKNDFTLGAESTKKKAQSTVNMGACLAATAQEV